MQWLSLIHGTDKPAKTSTFGPGDDVRVWYRILEQGKERFGQFEGTVLRCRGSGHSRTFTVRRVTHGEGVERVFPMDAKVISRIEVLRQGAVRRSRLYFLRRVIGKTRLSSVAAEAAAETTPIVNPSAAPGGGATSSADAQDRPEKSETTAATAGGPAAPPPASP